MGPGYPADGASGKLVAGVGSIENDLDVQNNLMATFEIQDGRKTQIKVVSSFLSQGKQEKRN